MLPLKRASRKAFGKYSIHSHTHSAKVVLIAAQDLTNTLDKHKPTISAEDHHLQGPHFFMLHIKIVPTRKQVTIPYVNPLCRCQHYWFYNCFEINCRFFPLLASCIASLVGLKWRLDGPVLCQRSTIQEAKLTVDS